MVTSPSAWVWSAKAEIARSSLTVSIVSFTSFAFNETRRVRRIHGLPRSSFLNDDSATSSSSLEYNKKPNSELPAWVKADKRWKTMSSVQDNRRPGLGVTSLRRRPLWKRIFFASKKVRSIILLNILTVIYASDIPVVKEVEMIMDPALFTMVRFVVTAIPFLPFLLQARGDCQARVAGIELGFWISLGYLSQALGLLTSEAGRASFTSAFTVIVVPLIDGMFGATVPALTWSGALISLIGVGILEYGGSPPCVGDILNILSAVFFGVHMLRTEQISRTTKKEKFLALLGYEVCVVALSSAIWFLLRDMFGDVHQYSSESMWDWMVSFPWIPALYTGLFSTGLCLWGELNAMRDVSATETAIVYGLEPVWGAAFAWFLLGERWGNAECIGAALVLCGSLTVQILGSPPEKCSKKVEEGSSNSSSDKQNNFSLSMITMESRKNVDDLFRRKDKL